MDNAEARQILREQLALYRGRSYAELTQLLNEQEVFEIIGKSGISYQVEIQAFWDTGRPGNLHVIGSIDDGGWRAFMPLTEDFILAPDGTFVDTSQPKKHLPRR